MRKIAVQFGVAASTVQTISRPFAGEAKPREGKHQHATQAALISSAASLDRLSYPRDGNII